MRFCTVAKMISRILEAGVRVLSEFVALDWRKQLQPIIHNAPDVFNRKKYGEFGALSSGDLFLSRLLWPLMCAQQH